MTFFHGTSADNLESILKNGFDGLRHEQIWDVSSGYNYFWSVDKLKEIESLENQEARKQAFYQAADNAECALLNSHDCRRVVFQVDLRGLEIYDDTSCPNMDGAIFVTEKVNPNRIKAVWRDEKDLTLFKPIWYKQFKNYNLFNFNAKDDLIALMAENLKEGSYVDMSEFEMERISKNLQKSI